MSSLDIAVSPPLPRNETVQVALLLAFASGYLGAVIANAEIAKCVLLWVYGTAGNWEEGASLNAGPGTRPFRDRLVDRVAAQ